LRFLQTFPQYLLTLPHKTRLWILILFWLPFLLLLIPHRGPFDILLVLPVVLATLLFKYRGGLIAVTLAVIQMAIDNTIRMGPQWPHDLFMAFIMGFFVFVVEAWVIGSQRHALEKETLISQQVALEYEQQRRLNNLKDHFLLNVSHELRTPLTEVRGYLELLQEYRAQLDDETKITFVNHAIRGCEELQLLISNMLDAMQVDLEQDTLNREELRLLDVVTEVVESFAPQKTTEHTLHLEIPETLMIWAEPQHTRQIIRNLLSNAFKYAPSQTPVFIQASSAENVPEVKDERQTWISIKDQGPGIPPADIPLLFNRFARLKRDLSGPIRGSGLGLYICKQLVEGMGGKIWLESSGVAGEGSRFCFTLPATPPTANAEETEATLVGRTV